jgi:hypothetical protein
MSCITKYYCDKCKTEVEISKLISFDINFNPYGKSSEYECNSKFFSICGECIEKMGFKKYKKNEVKLDTEKSSAEKLYDIISQICWENSPR